VSLVEFYRESSPLFQYAVKLLAVVGAVLVAVVA